MRLTRSISLVVYRYGPQDGFDGLTLHEAGLRVDATAKGRVVTVADATALLALLNGGLGHWLQTYWANRLLMGPEDRAAMAYSQTGPKTLVRVPAYVACGVRAQALASFLLTDVAPGIFDRHALQVVAVKVTMDPGDSAEATLGAVTATGSAEVVTRARRDAFDVWTDASSKTKFALVRRDRRNHGETS